MINVKNNMDLKDKNALGLEELKEDKEDRRRFFFFVFLFLIILFMSTFGLTVSFYKGGSSEPQEIETDPTPSPTESPESGENQVPKPSNLPIPADDKIIFTYSDVDKSGSGINLVNAIPISDEKGKMLTGNGNYFDFSITATSNKNDLVYKILINKDKSSTLANSQVRIYLTSLSGSFEKELVLTTFDTLETQKINNIEYYVLYQKKLEKGIKNYSDQYRLRMWVKDTAEDFNDKIFMLKVDVTAEQVGD